MFTETDLVLSERFLCRTWQTRYFPAGTSAREIARSIKYPEREVRSALTRQKNRIAEWEISKI